MVYVAANVHRAMEQVALDEDRPTSLVYVDAARAFLEAHGRQVGADPMTIAPPPALAAAELVEAIDRQGKRIDELQAAIAGIQGAAPRGGQGRAGNEGGRGDEEAAGCD